MNLIEAAAKAMYEAPDIGDDTAHTWPPSHPRDREWWLSRASAALTVFEGAYSPANVSEPRVSDISSEQMSVSAYTPTDDEREALAVLFKQVSQKFGGPSMAEFENDPPIRKHYATADAILAAGFHRVELVEPTEAEVAAIEQCVYDENRNQIAGMAKALVRAGWDAAGVGFHRTVQGEPGLRADVRNLTGATDAELDALGGFQGEPSDAQVEAALQSMGHSGSGVTPHVMRAALIAAAETGGER